VNGLLDGLAWCAAHQCPMLRVGDDYVCVVEHTNALLGMQRVIDVVPGSQAEPARLVFDSGRSMPLICDCCGGPFVIADVAAFRQEAVGLHLVAVGYVPPAGDEPEALELVLAPEDMLGDLPDELADPLPDGVQLLAVHIESARGIG
jgi:hypothetical protein